MMADVLFLDDDPDLLDLYSAWMRAESLEAVCVKTPPEALAVLAESSIPMIISDLTMPNMDGNDFAEEVRRRWPETYLVVCTGAHLTDTSREEALFDEVHEKPLAMDVLVAMIRRVLKEKTRHRRPGRTNRGTGDPY